MIPPTRSASSRPSAPSLRRASKLWPQRCAPAGHGDARVRDLIAELLWFHQRSQKPGWWAVFERQAWSEEELIDDAESLGGLQLDLSTAPVPVKKSFDTTYRFPPQDTKLKVGDTPKVAETVGYAGKIVDLRPKMAGLCCAAA